MKLYKYAPLFLKKYVGFRLSKVNAEEYKGFKGFRRSFDMLHCYLHFHVLPEEYDFYKFYNLRDCYRKNYLVRYDQCFTYARLNSSIGSIDNQHGKASQYTLFGRELLGRDWILLDDDSKKLEQIREFTKTHKKVVFKPRHGSLGIGIYLYENTGDENALFEAYQKCLGNAYLCEDYIVQNHILAEMHPGSVNTCRIVTLNDNGNIKIISATLKVGVSDCVVDNIRHEGIGATIDIESGIVCTPGYDYDRNEYFFHPESNKKIIGLEIPNWEKAKEVAVKGAELASRNRLIGWDIAITENGACIIEMNNAPGTKITQIYDMKPKGKPIFDYIKNSRVKPLSHKRKANILNKKFR